MAVHGDPLQVDVRIENLGAILRDTKAFDAKLATYIRREIRNAGKAAADDAKAEVLKDPPAKVRSARGFLGTRTTKSARSYDVGLRRGIAAGIAVRIVTGKRTNGVRIVAGTNRLPAGRKPMAKAYNTRSFRHPVFGNRRAWVGQAGRPYFGEVIYRRKADVQRGVLRALDMAAQTLAHRY